MWIWTGLIAREKDMARLQTSIAKPNHSYDLVNREVYCSRLIDTLALRLLCVQAVLTVNGQSGVTIMYASGVSRRILVAIVVDTSRVWQALHGQHASLDHQRV